MYMAEKYIHQIQVRNKAEKEREREISVVDRSIMTYDDMKDILQKSHFFQAKMKHHKCKPLF